MKTTSIFNEVIGPVMRGPSSSHTAGAFHLATLARSLLGDAPQSAEFTFDPHGSYGKVYREQGVDLAVAAALLDWSLTDARFPRALETATSRGCEIRFTLGDLPEADHPNTVRMRLEGRSGKMLEAVGKSVGGGAVEISILDGWPVHLTGHGHHVIVEVEREAAPDALHIVGDEDGDGDESVKRDGAVDEEPTFQESDGICLFVVPRHAPLPYPLRAQLDELPGVRNIWITPPIFFARRGTPLFRSAEEVVRMAEANDESLGTLALRYEAQLLGLSEDAIGAETEKRMDVMLASVETGLGPDLAPMQLLRPTAASIYAAEREGRVAAGGMHTRAAARALAAMHVNGSMGVVCAAPTAGSAGVLPAVLTTLQADLNRDRDTLTRALLAAGAVGVIISERATFAAEVAGCQVEIGAAGAMAAAAIVEAAGGSAKQGADAAAIALQNTMGSVCDLVQGIVEIPCHTRNATAASSAFVCADLILGGYENGIPLDETIDAVYAVGKMLPPELRCTALGGLAATPSGRGMKRCSR